MTQPLLKFGQPLGAIMQTAYIVPNLDIAIDHWVSTLKIGPWFIARDFAMDDVQYRGQPSDMKISLALAYSGSMCFELIQQTNNVPSVYTEVIEQRGYGFHHWGISTNDFDGDRRRLEAMGAEMAFYGVVTPADHSRAAYMNTLPMTGGMIELIEINPVVETIFSTFREASLNWDGSDPKRNFI